MKLTELIAQLQYLLQEHGDIEVFKHETEYADLKEPTITLSKVIQRGDSKVMMSERTLNFLQERVLHDQDLSEAQLDIIWEAAKSLGVSHDDFIKQCEELKRKHQHQLKVYLNLPFSAII